MKFYCVAYSGHFGFIKPWTAVRDGETFSQQFLTPSIIEGIRQKLDVSLILRHKLRYAGITVQQEKIQPRSWQIKKTQGVMKREQSIIRRGIMIYPHLTLAFPNKKDAAIAHTQHICLCRNEDLLLPDEGITVMTEKQFDALPGFELRFGKRSGVFRVGYNRFENGKPMTGYLEITGNPQEDSTWRH
jgi:hypothetical protein